MRPDAAEARQADEQQIDEIRTTRAVAFIIQAMAKMDRRE